MLTNKDAIDILQDYLKDDFIAEFDEDKEALRMAIKALEASAWIPVGERLPDANGLYLVISNKWGEWEVFVEIFYDGGWVEAEPVAWMPLPEPYKGGDDNDNSNMDNCNM